jgi:beta-mannanase
LWTTATLALGAILTGGFALTAAPAVAAGTTAQLSVYASDDAYTSSARKTYNTGQADKLVAGRVGTDSKVSYLKFTVGALADRASLTGAQLRLVLDANPAASTLTLSRVADTSWTEKTLTAANAPKVGAAVGAAKPASRDTAVAFDLGKVVTKPGSYAFALSSSARSDVVRFRAAEYGADGRPELRLTVLQPASPTPTTASPRPTSTKTPGTTPTTSTPTVLPTTTRPTTAPPTTPTPTNPTPTNPTCHVDAKLVPTCNVLWGAAAGGFTSTPRDQALKDWEATSGRTATIFHQYHKGDELFPTKAEIAMTRDAAKPRVLLLNWKVAYGTTWAKVAAGEKDARIDRWADFIKANYTDRFYLALHHEPENDVNATAGSGMTAKDFAAMYRHVIERLRAKGVTNAVNVLAYMGNEKWMAQSWWADLYPGDDVVDWIGLDSYVNAESGAYHYGTFADLLDRKGSKNGIGFYDWSVSKHPTKPLMMAEWGVYHSLTKVADKASIYNGVLAELKKRPQIKAMVYFDTEKDDQGDRNISIASSPGALDAFRLLAADPIFKVALR